MVLYASDATFLDEALDGWLDVRFERLDWDRIEGELMTFADSLRGLAPIDRQEGFRLFGRCLYRRVLVRVQYGLWPTRCDRRIGACGARFDRFPVGKEVNRVFTHSDGLRNP